MELLMINRSSRNQCLSVSIVLFLVIFSGGVVLARQDRRITDIRYWQSPDESQIVVDLSSAPKVTRVNSLQDGTFFFDIESCSFRPGRQRFTLDSNFVDALTVQERENGMVRIYFRVRDGITQRTFVLPENQSKPDRIVIFLSEPQSVILARRQEEIKQIERLKADNVRIVVLDPGHGGEDPGTRNNGIVEKNYVLTMGHLVKSYFDKNPRYKAILTRSGDYIIPLDRRRKIAEDLGADAFVSLHVNYNRSRTIRGIEVYYDSPRGASGEAERLVAEKENRQDAIAGLYAGATPMDTKRNIVELQAAVMYKSRQLAEKVEVALANSGTGLPSRGVRRAGFKVLRSLTMPSILVEYGYTSQLSDVQILLDFNARSKLAYATYLGIRAFLEGHIEEGKDDSYLEYLSQLASTRKRQARRASVARTYKVLPGDSLSSVAKKFKVNFNRLLSINKFNRNRHLKIGETIKIPGR